MPELRSVSVLRRRLSYLARIAWRVGGLALLAGFLMGPAQAQVIISEFMAANHGTVVDEDGDSSDWIELLNTTTNSVDLGGWHLTANAGNLNQWTFPSTNLGANCIMLVWASGKNRTTVGAPLHTSFSLNSAGEYLALVRPDDTLASEFAPTFPAQYDDVSYGVVQQTTVTTLLSNTALARVLVPTSGTLGTNWTSRTFDASAWRAGTNGVGYQALVSGFLVRKFNAVGVGTIGSVATAESVITNTALQSASYTEQRATINYLGTGGTGHYGSDAAFPGQTIGVGMANIVVEATGTITIPTAGNWTFGVNSDDGFRLTIGSFMAQYDGGRGVSDTLGVFNFPAAGDYPLRLVYFQGGGDFAVELFAGVGSWAAYDSSMQLVGNTGAGGLAARSLPIGTASYSALIKTDVQASMTNQNATAYIRLPFVVTNTASLQTLTLLMKYDDGFIACLNGTEVARRNAPASPVWNSTATVAHLNTQAIVDEMFDLTPALGQLVTGTNVLAIQGLNDSATGDDFLIAAQIKEYRNINLTNQYFAIPTPGTFNNSQPYYFKVADTKFNPDRGFYETNISVTITSATPAAVIRCTLDGSEPTLANGFTYTNAIPITNTTTLRAAAFKTGYTNSDVDTHTYVFIRDVLKQAEGVAPGAAWPAVGTYTTGQIIDYGLDPTVVTNPAYSGEISNDLRSIPSFSIVTSVSNLFDAANGIYVNPGQDTITWERACSLELIYPDGTKGFQANCGTRMRGGYSRSTDNPKHAFRFFFRNDYGPGQLNYPLCGTTNGATQSFQKFDLRTFQNYSWSFGGDSRFTAMRDVLNRDMQLAMGSAGSHGNYFHLYINGQYWGLYNIDERPEANFGESYFGGTAEQYDTIKTSGDVGYTIYATDGTTDAWLRLWQQATNGFDTTAAYEKVQGNNPDGTRNPAYENLLDIDNLIDYMLVHIYGGDIDAPISNFLGDASPNNIFCLRNTNNTMGFRFVTHDAEHTYLDVNIDRTMPFAAGDPVYQTNSAFSKSNPGYLWTRLSANTEFRMRVADHLQKYCFNNGVMTPAASLARFGARTNEIYKAIVLESARWGNFKQTNAFARTDWLAAVGSTGSFIQQRTAIVLAQLRSRGLFPTLAAPLLSTNSGLVPAGYSLSLTNTNGIGQIYYTVDGSDPRLLGGGLSPSAQVYTTNFTLNADLFIRARVKNSADWSALAEANLYVDQDFSKLIVSELMYNPPGGDNYEFLELKNVGSKTLDLSGVYFSAGITFTFTNGTLLTNGQRFVLARSLATFQSRYPGVAVGGIYTGKLDNGGEELRLTHPLGGTVLSFTYNDSAPWPAAPDGFGFSLVPVNANAPFDDDNPLNWRASTALYGSPGAEDPAPTIAFVVVNEILTSSTLPQVDAVELFNPTGADVDLGGWFITDDKNAPMKYRIPMPTIIPAGGYVVFDESQFNVVPGVEPSFSFSSLGEQVYLFSGVSGPVPGLTGYSHGFSFGGAAPGVSFGRYLNSVGDEQFPAQSALTLGTTNAGPLVGPVVINEIMYHPAPGGANFVELRNLTTNTVLFYDPAVPTNTWKINGLDFSFPTNAQIAADGFALVVGIDPGLFRTNYGVPTNVPIYGPFAGSLQNSGELLELQRPGAFDTNGVPLITVDAVRYNDKAPWPISADGDGPSLQRLISSAYGNDPTNWFASGATPGTTNIFNASPAVALISPAAGSTYTNPVSIALQAVASDSDGTVSKIEFFQNGLKIGEALGSPASLLWTNVPAGSYALTVRATDNKLATTTSTNVSITVFPSSTGTGVGLKGQYYDNSDFTTLKLTTTNGTINFDWGSGTPDASIGADTFSIRWTGMVQPRFSDTYTFYTTTDDGVRLWVNGQLLIDKWVDQGATEWSGSIALNAGQLYTIQMDYYENGGGASARLSWSSPNVPKEIIPQSQLSPITIAPAPAITQPPTSQTAAVGATAYFTVSVSGSEPLSYQWQRGGTNLPGATASLLTITNVQTFNAANYRVVVTNAQGSVTSAVAALTVLLPPSITQQPTNQAVRVGTNAVFTVVAAGSAPLSYQWWLSQTNLLSGATNATLTVSNVSAPMNGNKYRVVVNNLAGTVTSSEATLTLSDTVPPSISCPQNINTNNAPGQTSVTVTYPAPLASDNEGLASVGCLPISGSTFSLGVTTVRCTATDLAGNTNSCTFTITVRDTEPPTITFLTNAVLTANSNCQAAMPDLRTTNFIIAVDNASSVTITQSVATNTLLALGTNWVVLGAFDTASNVTYRTNFVRVVDTTAPAITCPTNFSLTTDSGRNSKSNVTFNATASDNCSTPTVICVPPSGSTFLVGTNSVTCTATDSSGNSNQCVFTVTVRDVENPHITCPANFSLSADAGRNTKSNVIFTVTATDNVAVAGIVCVPPTNSTFSLGATLVTCTATDTSSNTAQCSFTLTVTDNENPQITCPTNLLLCTDAGRNTKSNVTFTATASDNVTVTNLACVPPSGSTFALGTNTVTCTARDSSGNSAQCAFTVTVRDLENPHITCPGNQIFTKDAGQTSKSNVVFAPVATDNAAVTNVACVPPSGSTFSMGANVVNCTATDSSGNTALCSFNVTVTGQLIASTNDVVNLRIPDGSPMGLANSVDVSTPIERITDVNVSLVVTGGFNGDLHAYLVHDSGHAVLLNRVGKTLANPSGYSDPGFNVIFDDHATNLDVHNYGVVLSGNPNTPLAGPLSGLWTPDGRDTDPALVLNTDPRPATLSAFTGLNPNGRWTLFIADVDSLYSSTLVSWSLEILGTNAPPVITAQPQSRTNVAGTQATFTVTATTLSTPGYQWYFGAVPIAGATNATLTLSSVLATNAGDYHVVVTSLGGSVPGDTATLTVLSLQVTGQVALERYVGPAHDGRGQRAVTFKATDGSGIVLATWNQTLTFAPGADGYGVVEFTLDNVPVGTAHVSAKTAWNLRQRLTVTFAGRFATANFTEASLLPGGDIAGATTVNLEDYYRLAASWYLPDGAADIDGSGRVDLDDYFILSNNWLKESAAE